MQETEDIVTRLRQMSRLGYWPLLGDEAADTIATLRAEVEGLRADAERYRWLRTRVGVDDRGVYLTNANTRFNPEGNDAAIDAAKADKEGA